MQVIREGLNFYIELGKDNALIKCEKKGSKLLIVTSYTPEEHRGKGLASAIMKEVISYARDNGLEIVPVCSFAVNYCKEHKCLNNKNK